MGSLAPLRGISNIVARLGMRPGSGGHPTDRWQDKSREVRGGRSAGKRAMIKDLARCTPAHESLPDRASHCKYKQERTSRLERDDTRR
jgi:hypothetical protein